MGDGGLYTTLGDLALWDKNFYNNQLGEGPEFIDMILTPYKYSESGADYRDQPADYAFALFRDTYNGEERVWHSGGWGDLLDSLITTVLNDYELKAKVKENGN